MKKKVLFVITSICLAALLAGCQCKHQWVEADCTTAKTCSLCGETEGEPLGHFWLKATCTDGPKCVECGAVAGEPAGHTPGEVETRFDPDYPEFLYKGQYCENCEELLSTEKITLTDYIDEETDTFIFSPENLLRIMEHYAKERFPDFCYEITDQDGKLSADIYWEGTDKPSGTMLFFDGDNEMRSAQYANVDGVWCVSLLEIGIPDRMGTMLTGNKLWVMAKTLDPSFDDDDELTLSVMKITTAMNWIDFGEPQGYWTNNDLLYEFGHMNFPGIEASEALAIEQLLIYASDYRTNK